MRERGLKLGRFFWVAVYGMAKKLNDAEWGSFKEMLIATSAMVDALAQLLIAKGLVTESEFHEKLKQVQKE
jgi:hypothetical protein